MKKLFDVNSSYHGSGHVCYSWQGDGSYLASVGTNSLLVIFDRHGQQVRRFRYRDGVRRT